MINKVIFTNLTEEQARELASWYWKLGEQQCESWFEAAKLPIPIVDKIEEKLEEIVIRTKSYLPTKI
jgi:hypothetical protein